MYFAHIALTVAYLFVRIYCDSSEEASNQNNDDDQESPSLVTIMEDPPINRATEDPSIDSTTDQLSLDTTTTDLSLITTTMDPLFVPEQTFVTLISILFSNKFQKPCTGSIIHERVVITAAHCFVAEEPEVKVELAGSFIVIGTKNMFSAGHEQYIPIERILTHPKFDGWNSDLTLVYTFASMTFEKSGSVIPLAGEEIKMEADTNFTILSWGAINYKNSEYENNSASNEFCDQSDHSIDENEYSSKPKIRSTATLFEKTNGKTVFFRHRTQFRRKYGKKKDDYTDGGDEIENSSLLATVALDEDQPFRSYHKLRHSKKKIHADIKEFSSISSRFISDKNKKSSNKKEKKSKNSSKHHRYSDETRKNNDAELLTEPELATGNFSFVDLDTCEFIIQRALPDKFNIRKTNDVICYGSENRYIDDNDSGAPVIHGGKLVAVTARGTVCKNEYRVAIGMKMSCYCSWIAEHLPKPSSEFNCCSEFDCCEDKSNEDNTFTKQF